MGGGSALLGTCGPFTDVAPDAFCPFLLEIFTLGITTGTTATTYDPSSPVTRLQMAAFLSRTVDGLLTRRSERAPIRRFWTTRETLGLALTTVGNSPAAVESDGADLWVANVSTVSRVRGSDGRLLETWTGADFGEGVLAAMGKIFVTGHVDPGRLYRIDPSQPAGAVTTVSSGLGGFPLAGIVFDGSRIWTANAGSPGSVSIVTPGPFIPWSVTTVTAGFTTPVGMVYDGANVWATDTGTGAILKLDASGAVLQTVSAGPIPVYPAFDGTNIWIPNDFSGASSVTVVRASNGAVLATLTGNGLDQPITAAFDGQLVLVTSENADRVSLWRAGDLTALGSLSTGASTAPVGACSDGINFWIVLGGSNQLARF
ncbi:MAG TPA: S-layer homology domain-containing protein [Thermoanaerobaculia bacterium]|nr:S-layer homology domain-containing protein [Thermoanaerobaculia bacterium]